MAFEIRHQGMICVHIGMKEECGSGGIVIQYFLGCLDVSFLFIMARTVKDNTDLYLATQHSLQLHDENKPSY